MISSAQSVFLEEINEGRGYSTRITLTERELTQLRQMIRMQWLYRLQVLVPQHIRQFDSNGIEYYHRLSHLIDHQTAWPKVTRVLPREAVCVIRKMDFFKTLESLVGPFYISDEEYLGWENIYWRLVRPNECDVGSLHADRWFWEIGGYGEVASFPHTRLKIWIAIYTVSGKNGFLVVPGSHLKQDWRWHIEKRYGLLKPVLNEPIDSPSVTLLPLSPGESVVFHDSLIHGGALNTADTVRVNLEFTLLIPRDK